MRPPSRNICFSIVTQPNTEITSTTSSERASLKSRGRRSSFIPRRTEGSRIAFLLLFFICATKARQTPARLGERAYEIGVCSLPLKNDCQRMNWELNFRMLCEIPALCPKPASSLHDWSSSGLQFCEGFLSSHRPEKTAPTVHVDLFIDIASKSNYAVLARRTRL